MSDLNSSFRPINSRFSEPRRPGSESLSGKPTTVAAQAFAKDQETKKEFAPAISTGFTPPVINQKEESKNEPSPFKPIPKTKAPIKRSDSINAFKKTQDESSTATADKPIFKPIEQEDNSPSIAKFNPLALDSLPAPDFQYDPEVARSKSIKARQTATELKFMPFDESTVQRFDDGKPKPTLKERVESTNTSELKFTPIAEPDSLGTKGIGHIPTLKERINSKGVEPFAFTEEKAPSDNSPFKPLKQTESKSSNKSPFAPRRDY